jgi:UDP-glucose 4-epimerase
VGRLGGGTGLFNEAVRRMALGQRTGVLSSATLHQAMYNRDMAAFLVAALLGPRPKHHLFNTPVERDYSDTEVLTVLRKVCPGVDIHMDPIPDYIPKVPIMDGSRALNEIAFKPRYTLEDGVREMVTLFRTADPLKSRPGDTA